MKKKYVSVLAVLLMILYFSGVKQQCAVEAAHNYLYQQILKVVDSNYEYCDYNWNRTIVNLDD